MPDVRAKRSAYLMSAGDMCFGCETLADAPAELSVLSAPLRQMFTTFLMSGGTHMKFSLAWKNAEAVELLYLKARVIFFF